MRIPVTRGNRAELCSPLRYWWYSVERKNHTGVNEGDSVRDFGLVGMLGCTEMQQQQIQQQEQQQQLLQQLQQQQHTADANIPLTPRCGKAHKMLFDRAE